MKPKFQTHRFANLLFVSLALAVPSAQAATLNWDPTASAGANLGGATTSEATEWKTGAETVWWDGSANVAWTNGNDATFSASGTGTAGNVRLGGSNATISIGTLNFGVTGYTIDLKDFTDNTANNLTVTGISGSTATITNTSGTTRNFTLNSSTDQTWSGTITSQRVTFIKQGVGKLSFSGAVPDGFGANTFDIQNGEVEFTGAVTTSGSTIVNIANGATLDLNGKSFGNIRVINTGATSVLDSSGGSSTINLTYGSTSHNLAGKITAGVRFNFQRTDTATFSNNNNDFTGGVTAGVNFSSATPITINVNADNGLGTGPLSLTSNNANNITRVNFTTAAPSVGSISTTNNVNTKTLTLGTTDVNTNLSVGALNTNTNFGGVIQNFTSQTGSLTKVGTGSLTLSGANTYTGTTTIKNGSIIIGGGNDRLATTGSVVLGDASTSGKLVLGDGTARNQTLAGLTTTGLGGSVVGGATAGSTLTLGIASGTNTFDGVLGGTGTNENKLALTKSGSGMLTLTGTNTYTGATTIEGGTLLIGGAQTTATGAITVKSTGLLGGNGSSGATVTMESGGGLAARIMDWTGSAGTGYDDLEVVSLDAANIPINLNITTTALANFTESAKSFTILNTTGGITNFSPSNVTIAAPGFTGTGTWSVAVVTDALVLSYNPSTGSNTFTGWANANSVTGGVNGDSDNDGIPNGVEYGLNTNPAGSDGAPGTYTGTLLSFDKRTLTSGNADLSYRIEVSPDLGTTPWVEVGSYVTNTTSVLSANIPTGPGLTKYFARLRVVVTP